MQRDKIPAFHDIEYKINCVDSHFGLLLTIFPIFHKVLCSRSIYMRCGSGDWKQVWCNVECFEYICILLFNGYFMKGSFATSEDAPDRRPVAVVLLPMVWNFEGPWVSRVSSSLVLH